MTQILSFSLDRETSDSLAAVQRGLKFRNRSDAIRAAVRSLINEIDEVSQLTGTITSVAIVVHSDSADAAIDRLKHDFQDIVVTQVHNYFSANCIEVFVLNGQAKRIREFAEALKTKPQLKYSKLVNPHAVHRHAGQNRKGGQ